jgi:hypothetical protein
METRNGIMMESDPKTIQELTKKVESQGGKVEHIAPRMIRVWMPKRFRDTGTQTVSMKLHSIGDVGWFYRDGKAHISNNIHAIQRKLK